jgi:protein O-GlcNAc transferase
LSVEQQIAQLREETMQMTQGLVAAFPNEAEAHVLLGNSHRQFGQSAEALLSWNRALRLDPDRTDVYDALAGLALEKGQSAQALQLWQQVLERAATLPGVRTQMARALLELDRQEAALNLLKEDEQLAPESPKTLFLLGQVSLNLKRDSQAIQYYQKALALDPNLHQAYHGLFRASARLKRQADADRYRAQIKAHSDQLVEKERLSYGFTARDDLQKARHSLAALALSVANHYVTRGQSAMASAVLEQAVAVDPNHVDCRKKLAASYRATGRRLDALKQCEHIARLQPQDPTCHIQLALLAQQLGQFDRAEWAYRKVIRLAPRRGVGYRELANLYMQSGKDAGAARSLAEKAVQVEPTPDHYTLLGRICWHLGDKASARASLAEALRLDPANSATQAVYQQMETGR